VSDAARTIRDIHKIRGCPNFPRNTRPNLAQYISEQPELTSHGEKPKKAKTTKGKLKMKHNKIISVAIALCVTAFFTIG